MSEQHQFDIKVTAPTMRTLEITTSVETLEAIIKATIKLTRRTKADSVLLRGFGEALAVAMDGSP